MPRLDIFDLAGQSAVYADGVLVHWGERLCRERLLLLVGVDSAVHEPPTWMAAHAKENGWSPPPTLELLRRRNLEEEASRLDRAIAQAERRLSELKRERHRLAGPIEKRGGNGA